MASVRLYALIYVALLTLATAKVVYFDLFDYWTAVSLTFLSAFVKAGLIASFYMHLRYEPRSITYVFLGGLSAVLLLTLAAGYSIT